MSTDKNVPPAIAPKVVVPRPDSPGRPNATPPPPGPPQSGSSDEGATMPEMERASGAGKVAVARAGAVEKAAAAMAAAKTANDAVSSAPVDEKSVSTDTRNEEAVPPVSPPGSPTNGTVPLATSGGPGAAPTQGVGGTATAVMTEAGPGGASPEASGVSSPAGGLGGVAAESSSSRDKEKPRDEVAPRKVRLAVSKVNPWSVMKLSFLLSVGIGIMFVVAIIVFWLVLDGMHVFSKADDFVQQVVGDAADVNILQFVEFSRVVSQSLIIAVVNILLMTVLSTIMAVLYNVTSSLVGGLHVTLTDD